MINLISFIRPFSIEQKIFIRDSAVPDKINIVSTNLSKYPETIFELIEQYNLKSISVGDEPNRCIKVLRK